MCPLYGESGRSFSLRRPKNRWFTWDHRSMVRFSSIELIHSVSWNGFTHVNNVNTANCDEIQHPKVLPYITTLMCVFCPPQILNSHYLNNHTKAAKSKHFEDGSRKYLVSSYFNLKWLLFSIFRLNKESFNPVWSEIGF